MSPFLTRLIGGALNRFTRKNLNPKETPSTGMAYAGAATIATMQAYPQTEHDALIQLAIAIISAYCFYSKKK